MFGKTEIEYGIRMGTSNTPDWRYGTDKRKRDAALKRFNKNAKAGKECKGIQRSVKVQPKNRVVAAAKNKITRNDPCKGGKCKRNGFCVKHAKSQVSGSDYELYDARGRNKNTKRWDE